ncbi:glycosyltransferase family A protein [Mobilicoccus sp.]|uniref:glycosyltransferase n=1 Tax=Mobilicoccus sp. TaxID=2034349 RepID=UPI0028AB98C6|nr:glycosyltransferase family A protein [Mobilicoccus sp.]
MSSRRYALVSPCRDEEDHLPTTLASVAAQSEPPAAWVVVDDGSTDASPKILADFVAEHDYVRVITRQGRDDRVLGSAVVEAFEEGVAALDLDDYDYVVKLDVDLDLPPTYFARLMDLMEEDPRLASVSGVACVEEDGSLVPERGSAEMSVGMSKFYRVSAYRDIGGFVPMLMWDGIDCHTARAHGWRVRSVDEPDLRFRHLRPMGSSDRGLLRGKRRHGRGQYLMGTHPAFLLASTLVRTRDDPPVIGAAHMLAGYVAAAAQGADRFDDEEVRRQLRRFQLESLVIGKRRAVRRWEERTESRWPGREQSAAVEHAARPEGDPAHAAGRSARQVGRPGRRVVPGALFRSR